jgi:hypothetical protein
LKSPRNDTGIAMTNLHRSPPMNQSKTDLGIVNESQLLRFGISPATQAQSAFFSLLAVLAVDDRAPSPMLQLGVFTLLLGSLSELPRLSARSKPVGQMSECVGRVSAYLAQS